MSVAATAASAQVPENQSGNYISPGDYLLQATAHKENTNDGKLAFIAEHDVLWSKPMSNPHPEDPPTLSPGLSGTLYVDCKKFKGSLAWQVKAYLAALTQTDEEEIDEDGINAVLTSDQPCVGMIVRCKAWTHVTANKVRITRTKFAPASEDDVKRVAQLRKEAGLEPLPVPA